MNTNVNASQLSRVTADWSKIAGETLVIEASEIDAPVYAFGSELACLRLFHKMPNGRAAYSQNLKTWYFVNK